jgi:hypothetical protein
LLYIGIYWDTCINFAKKRIFYLETYLDKELTSLYLTGLSYGNGYSGSNAVKQGNVAHYNI